ncbi:MAG: TolC family protein [Kiritimatiellia bacterium]
MRSIVFSGPASAMSWLACAIVLLAGDFSAAADVAPPAPVLTLQEFCRKVLAYYPRLKEQAATVELAVANKLQAQAGYLPGLQAQAGATYGDDPVYVFGSRLRQRAFTQEDFDLDRLNRPNALMNFDVGLRGEVPLFNAFQTISRVRQARHMVKAAKHDEEFMRMEAVLLASDSYLNALAVEMILGKVEATCRLAEIDIKQAESLKEKGVVLGADYYSARVMCGGLRNSRNNFAAQRQSMHALLNILMGEDPFKPLRLAGALGKEPGPEPGLQEWLSRAGQMRPDLKAIDQALRAREENLSGARSSAWPVISAFGDVRADARDFQTGGGNFTVGLRASMDIFDPGYSSRVSLAQLALKKMKLARSTVADSIARDITSEHARLESLSSNVPVLREMSADSDRAVEMALPLYREGRKSIADLIEMRQGNVMTYQGYYSALAGLKNASVRLMFLSGQLDEAQAASVLGEGQSP